MVKPIVRFMHVEAAGGIVLLVCTVAALVLANSRFADGFLAIWKTEVGFRFGDFEMIHSLKHWISDGLMAIFFFVVGLEVKRELVLGELRDVRRATLPVAAALGGMVVPAGFYLALQWGEEGARATIKQFVSPSPCGIEVKPAYALEGGVLDEVAYKSKIGVDLTVLDIWSPTTPMEAQVWETVALRIRNEGTDHANPRFYTRMWFDRTLIRTWYADGLQAGATAIGWVQLRVAEPGSHEIRVQVDVTHAVTEADEENNTLIETWEWVQPQPVPTTQPPTIALPGQAVDGSAGLPAPAQPAQPAQPAPSGREQARELWREALAIYEELGDPQGEDVRARLAALDA